MKFRFRPLLRSHATFIRLNGVLLAAAAVVILLAAADSVTTNNFIGLGLALLFIAIAGVVVNGYLALQAAVLSRQFLKAGAYLVAAMVWAFPLWWMLHMGTSLSAKHGG